MTYLVGAILLIEIIRLILSIRDARTIATLNKKAMERQEKALEFEKTQHEEWKKLRQAELIELGELLKGSKELECIVNEFKQKLEES